LFTDESEFADLLARAEVLKPEFGLQPRVYYLNVPKLFVAGEIYDPDLDECLADVEVTLTDEQSGKVRIERTDEFGDYWFKKLAAGSYTLKVVKEGYKPFEKNGINLGKSLKMKDIVLTQAK
jgi:tetrathionate reductase subunit B